MIIRTAEREDIAAIVALLADDQLGATRETPGDPPADCYLAAFEAMAAQGSNRYLIALDEQEGRPGSVVGCLQLTMIAGLSRRGMTRAQIEGVRVAASHRGAGVGEALMRHAIEQARAAGCGLVQLTTDKRRPDAHRFYDRLGFVASHEGMKLDLTAGG